MQNVLRRAVVLAGGETIRAEHLPPALQAGGARAAAAVTADADGFHRVGDRLATIDELERRHIEYALRACDHNLSLVARALRIGRTTLYRKLQAYGIETA
jgi:two-component system response regulator HydG